MQQTNLFEKKHSVLYLTIILISGLIIRLYYTPFDTPIHLDAVDYFVYALIMNRENEFVDGYLFSNIGWSTILSTLFFDSYNSTMLELMNIQRVFSEIISIFSALPIYFLCRKFFNDKIALLAVILFVFDPRVIENSIFGITEPLYILFVILTILFIFYKEGKMIYLSFIFVALTSFVRYEGLLLIIPVMLSFIFQRKNIKKEFVIGSLLFIIIFISINFIGYNETGKTLITDQIFAGGNYMSSTVISGIPDEDDPYFGEGVGNKFEIFLSNTLFQLGKYLIWILIPIYLIFCIFGLKNMNKKITGNKIIIIMFLGTLLIPAIYAYGRGIEETRYLLVILPFFSLLSCYTFHYLKKINFNKIFFLLLSGVIISTIVFTEIEDSDEEFYHEIYDATTFLVKDAKGVNDYTGNTFVKVAELEQKWPEILPKGDNGKMGFETKKFSIKEFDNPKEYILFNKDNDLTHLLIIKDDRSGFFNDMYENESKYPFLEKIYDSDDMNLKTKYKIFKIDYSKIN